MFYISQVTMKSGEIKWAIKDRFSGKTVMHPCKPTLAQFHTLTEAQDILEECVAKVERETA